MTNSVKLSDLKTRVEANIDSLSLSADSFVSTNDMRQFINDGLAKIHYLMASMSEGDYYNTTSTIAFVDGTAEYSLPADFYKLQGVDYVLGSIRTTIRRYMQQQRNKYSDTGFARANNYQYKLDGQKIKFIPTPGSGSFVIDYIQQFVPLVNETDTVSDAVPVGWEEYAVIYATIRFLQKEESNADFYKMQLNEMWMMMKDFFSPRDQTEPMRITDVRKIRRRGTRMV